MSLRSIEIRISLYDHLYVYFYTMHDDFDFIWIYSSILYMHRMLTILIAGNLIYDILKLNKNIIQIIERIIICIRWFGLATMWIFNHGLNHDILNYQSWAELWHLDLSSRAKIWIFLVCHHKIKYIYYWFVTIDWSMDILVCYHKLKHDYYGLPLWIKTWFMVY